MEDRQAIDAVHGFAKLEAHRIASSMDVDSEDARALVSCLEAGILTGLRGFNDLMMCKRTGQIGLMAVQLDERLV